MSQRKTLFSNSKKVRILKGVLLLIEYEFVSGCVSVKVLMLYNMILSNYSEWTTCRTQKQLL